MNYKWWTAVTAEHSQGNEGRLTSEDLRHKLQANLTQKETKRNRQNQRYRRQEKALAKAAEQKKADMQTQELALRNIGNLYSLTIFFFKREKV